MPKHIPPAELARLLHCGNLAYALVQEERALGAYQRAQKLTAAAIRRTEARIAAFRRELLRRHEAIEKRLGIP
jgi:hypothetical protein